MRDAVRSSISRRVPLWLAIIIINSCRTWSMATGVCVWMVGRKNQTAERRQMNVPPNLASTEPLAS